MIFKKMLPLLTAASISGGVVTLATLAPSVIASEQTMANQYEPYYVETTQRAETSFYVPAISSEPLPKGTSFSLLGINWIDRYKSEDGLIIGVSDNGEIRVQRSIYGNDWTAEGRTTSVDILVSYPDGSSEIIETEITFIPEDRKLYSPTYSPIQVAAGELLALNIQTDQPLPAGVNFRIPNSTHISNLIAEGWNIAVQTSGTVLLQAPEGTSATSFELLVVVQYLDGTSDLIEIPVTITEPQPLDSERHEVIYGDVAVSGGKSVTLSPTETGLPTGTRISLAANTALTAAGWALDVTADGELTATAPDDADGTVEIALTVTYPDGTTEATTAKITATPAPKDDEDDEDDQPVVPTRPKAGGSSFGSS